MSATPRRNYFDSQGLRLSYVEWGREESPTLILLHGMLDHARAWDSVAEGLSDRWRVVALDLRGHGESDWSKEANYPILNYIYDLDELIESLGLNAVVLAGHSLGGTVAVRYAGVFPDRVSKLVSIEGLDLSSKRNPRSFSKGTTLRSKIVERKKLISRIPKIYSEPSHAERRLLELNPRLKGELIHHLVLHGLKKEGEGFVWKYDGSVRSSWPADLSRDEIVAIWKDVVAPTLFVYGAESWASSPLIDGRVEFFQNAIVKVIPHAGHSPHHDQLELFLAELIQFIND